MLPVRLCWPAVGGAICLLTPVPGAGQVLYSPAPPDSVGLRLEAEPRPSLLRRVAQWAGRSATRRVLVPGLLVGPRGCSPWCGCRLEGRAA
ncbi:hypothetical protein F1C16_21075 (plasmid) [Hymenobacter sp. NBH84]|uniref:hypothetical protein n=1 Tax=Hymenobacter sp. NBH84 TaxID=2596915 RepID=UPI001624E655|nr:hypothetical protein [Hymenobacter sp. NBH84]QNE42117.1 hypothetical protein F1C16_21075 [Hymenobacter sp. NBH84]